LGHYPDVPDELAAPIDGLIPAYYRTTGDLLTDHISRAFIGVLVARPEVWVAFDPVADRLATHASILGRRADDAVVAERCQEPLLR
jgi:hypothetical protein